MKGETFAQTVEKALSAKAKRRAELEPLITKFKNGAMSPRDKQAVLEKMLENDKTNGEILLWLAYYNAIGECLMNERTEKSLIEKAGESPEYILTAHTALGFWAEGSGDKKKAVRHYKEALGSYMDERVEYEFAIERIKKLRQISE